MNRSVKSHYPYAFMLPALVVFGIFYALPSVASFGLSFTDWDISRLLAPVWNGLDNFVSILGDDYFTASLWNTLLFAVVTSVGKVGFGLILALALTQKLYTSSLLRSIFYVPCILSMVVIGLVMKSVLRYDGMLNHILMGLGLFSEPLDWLGTPGVSLWCTMAAEIWRWSGFTMAIFIAGLQAIPRDYYEAADIDGARAWQKFSKVTLPLLAPAMTVATTMNVIGGLKVFDQVYIMTNGGPGFTSQVISTYVYRTFSEGRLGKSTAMGLLLFLVVSLVALVFNRQMKKREVAL